MQETKKILVVDDEALLVKGIRFNLQNEGYDVITGSDGLEAVLQSPYLCQVWQTARMGTNPTARQRAISNRLKFSGRFSGTDRRRTQSDGASILKLTTPLQGWLLSRCQPRCRAKLRKVLYLQGFSSLRQRKQRRKSKRNKE